MPFPRRLLFDGEEVVVELRPHWIFLGWPLIATAAALALAISVIVAFPHAPVGVSYVLGVVVLVPALWLLGRVARWMSTSIVVTTNRIVERWGVFSRRADEVRLEAVNQISYHQTILDRLFRVGTVFIEVPGRTGVIVYRCLRRPDVVQRIISEQTAELYGRGPTAIPGAARPAAGGGASNGGWTEAAEHRTPPTGVPAATRGGPVVDAMAQLDELRSRGLLTDAEYADKKAELLRRL
ncbi:MAG TPA: PH domain-containing protein [Acidimicrobiales bacterium]|nr:PH domain-containing protein [Acidimicrobiales bacterium]